MIGKSEIFSTPLYEYHDRLYYKMCDILSKYSNPAYEYNIQPFIDKLSVEDLRYCLGLDKKALEDIMLTALGLFWFKTFMELATKADRIDQFKKIIERHKIDNGYYDGQTQLFRA